MLVYGSKEALSITVAASAEVSTEPLDLPYRDGSLV
jgi:hypothetical protein